MPWQQALAAPPLLVGGYLHLCASVSKWSDVLRRQGGQIYLDVRSPKMRLRLACDTPVAIVDSSTQRRRRPPHRQTLPYSLVACARLFVLIGGFVTAPVDVGAALGCLPS